MQVYRFSVYKYEYVIIVYANIQFPIGEQTVFA